MSNSTSDQKARALSEQGILNPRPEDVQDSLFQESDFFDPRDLLQVKYEMVRRHQVEGLPAASAARSFGFSRVTFYQTIKKFEQDGLGGLFPKLRGPKSGHKLTEELVAFIESALVENPTLRPPGLAEFIKVRFGISVHPRSIERALARRQKKRCNLK